MNKTSVALVAAIASCGAFAKTIDLNGEWNFSKDGGRLCCRDRDA